MKPGYGLKMSYVRTQSTGYFSLFRVNRDTIDIETISGIRRHFEEGRELLHLRDKRLRRCGSHILAEESEELRVLVCASLCTMRQAGVSHH